MAGVAAFSLALGAEMIVGFDHVAITVADLEASSAFFGRALDARVADDYAPSGRSLVRRVLVGGAVLSLHQEGNGVTPVASKPQPGSADICFRWSGDIATAVARLQAAGVAIEEGPVARVAADGRTGASIYFRDLDGNLLELLTVAPSAPAAEPSNS